MFSNPFSFRGRIRRLEYVVSLTAAYAAFYLIGIAYGRAGENASLLLLGLQILCWWFLIAQGAKRCHDLGHSGWWQLIPLYGLWMIFAGASPGSSKYGLNPKERQLAYVARLEPAREPDAAAVS